MKGFFLANFLLLFTSTLSFSQTIISGNVRDSNGKPLEGVTVLAYKMQDDYLLSNDITDTAGGFTLDVSTKVDSVRVLLQMIGFKSQTLLLPNIDHSSEFTLSKSGTDFDKEIIQEKKLTKFQEVLEQNIPQQEIPRINTDLGYNYPGVSISPKGTLHYYGQELTNYTITLEPVLSLENDSLLSITDSFSSIETNKSNSIDAKDKSTKEFTTEMIMSGGVPFLWDIMLQPTIQKENFRSTNTFHSSNSGKNDIKKLQKVDLRNLFKYGSIESVPLFISGQDEVNSKMLSNDFINTQETHSFQSNSLFEKGNSTFQVNLSGYTDQRSQAIQNEDMYFAHSDTIHFSDKCQSNFKNNYVAAQLGYQFVDDIKKINNKIYFKYLDHQEQSIIDWNNQEVQQDHNSHFYTVGNQLDVLYSLKEDSWLSFNSFIEYQHQPEDLFVNGGPLQDVRLFWDDQQYDQKVETTTSKAYVSSAYKKQWNNIALETKMDLSYSHQKLSSSLGLREQVSRSDTYVNDIESNSFIPSIRPEFSFKKGRFLLTATPQFAYQFQELNNSITTESDHVAKLTFEPATKFHYKSDRFFVELYHRRDVEFNSLPDIYSGYILTDYRTFLQKNLPLLSNTVNNYHAQINTFLELLMLDLTVNYNYETVKRNWISSIEVQEDGLNGVSYIVFDENLKDNQSIQAILGWDISSLHTKINGSYTFGQLSEDIMVTKVLSNNLGEYQRANASINLSMSDRLNLIANYQYFTQRNSFQFNQLASITESSVGATLEYTTPKHHFNWENNYLENSALADGIIMMNMNYDYTFTSKKVRIGIEIQNLLDEKSFATNEMMFYQTTNTYFQLRGRQVLGSIRWML
ncbi:carboxypeptidase-like regulatory domain-containing protein [Flammeovirga agarivorans]|uniref:Carboxypeptidase regulatory-like domain-containing protein n=1 Tax=Flammeovirga agarivorans TaxID=2726742 RepID=A0A7X8SNT2_9BACT|nr:carboxypeptidase-like regulatory domain-containing protein [Flammeovirga agarivorans]NLR93550.1 carboxypeptidase regulatory-like domain-containing protein [Flammeovirga agarivorans]